MPGVLLLQVHINTMPLLLLVFCTVTSCYTFGYTVTYVKSCTFKSTYIIINACGSWSTYIRREVSSYFRPQTLQLAFQTSKFGLQTCSLHDKCLCTQAQTIFFRTILIVKTALAAMFDIGWGSSTKPLKGDPNYIIYPKFW